MSATTALLRDKYTDSDLWHEILARQCWDLACLQDHYENIYAVICGVKVFFLLPPADAYRLGITPYPMAQYARDQLGRLKLSLVDPKQVKPIRYLSGPP